MSSEGTRDKTPLTDFSDCVSKNEIQKLIWCKCSFIDENLNQIMQTVNILAKWIKDVKQQWPKQHRPEDDIGDDDLKDDEGNDDEDSDAWHVACGTMLHERVHHKYRVMAGKDRGNNDPFSKTKFKMLPF